MHAFIIGVTGGVGSLLAADLVQRGDTVAGLVRKPERAQELQQQGITAMVGDLTELTPAALAALIGSADAIVFTAGAGGSRAATTAIDGGGLVTAIAAADLLPNLPRFALVSVFPEAGRELHLGADFDHYIDVKKRADIALTRSDLDYVILRPSSLLDGPGTGAVSLGPAQLHETITRADVAATLAGLLHEPRISRQILEVTAGETPVADAIAHNANG